MGAKDEQAGDTNGLLCIRSTVAKYGYLALYGEVSSELTGWQGRSQRAEVGRKAELRPSKERKGNRGARFDNKLELQTLLI